MALRNVTTVFSKCGPEAIYIRLIQDNCQIRLLGPAQSIKVAILMGGDRTHQVFLMHFNIYITTTVHTIYYNLVEGGWQIFFLYGYFSIWGTPPGLP